MSYSINKIIASKNIKQIPNDFAKYVDVKLNLQNETKKVNESYEFIIFKDKLDELISELNKAQEIIEKLE